MYLYSMVITLGFQRPVYGNVLLDLLSLLILKLQRTETRLMQ